MTATGERRASATDAAILEIVRRRAETSRVEISRELGVTPATVTYAVKRLLAAELLVESGFARSKGGKRASLLRVNDQARWAIGCTLDTDRLSLVGVDMTGALRSRIALPLTTSADAAEVTDTLDRALSMMEPHPGTRSTTGIGFAIPYGRGGSRQHGRDGMQGQGQGPAGGQELLHEVTGALDLPSISASTPTCAALGSFWSGEQPESGLCATVHMDAGLGMSILQDGRPLQPASGSAATLDHVSIDPDGPPCDCGGSGCLHQYASSEALIAAASRAGSLARDLGLGLTAASRSSDAVLIALAAARGESRAGEVFEAAISALAQAVWSATSALGIEAIVLSGPGVQAAPVLVGETMDRLLSARARNIGADVTVSVSQVQPHPCAVGAAVLALQTFMTPGRASRGTPVS